MSNGSQVSNSDEDRNPVSAGELLPVVYEELRKLARFRMSNEPGGHTLQATALVHEAWLRLTSGENPAAFGDRRHFFGAAAEAMRRILVESARRKKCTRRGGEMQRVDMDGIELPLPMPDDDIIAMHEALDKLVSVDARAAEVVKLCFFVGMTREEAARELEVSLSTVERLWAFARAWLFREIKRMRADAPPGESN